MTKKRIKEDSSSSEPVVLATPAKSEPVVLATPTKTKKIKIEKEEIVDLTGDPQFIDSAEGYDPDWKSSRPASPMQPPKSTTYPKPGRKYIRPTAKLGATSKPVARGSAPQVQQVLTLLSHTHTAKKEAEASCKKSHRNQQRTHRKRNQRTHQKNEVVKCIRKLNVPIYSSFLTSPLFMIFPVFKIFCSNLLEFF